MKAKKIILKRKLQGVPKESDYEIVEEELPALKNGEFLVEAHYISVDPYMRIFTPNIGDVVFGDQVAKVIESKHAKFPVGQFIIGEFGWTTHKIATEQAPRWSKLPPRPLPDLGNLPKSLPLGILGMPGNTAYFGFVKHYKPKRGDVFVISAAGGCVGSHVGQIAKMHGCHVVGITGSDDKGKWLTADLNFDSYINYKTGNFAKKLSDALPKGIDCYFDNVGGQYSHTVLNNMKKSGTFIICGSIATYVGTEITDEREEYKAEIEKFDLQLEWVNVFKSRNNWNEGIEQNLQWIKDGKLKYHETVTEGFENVVKAFIGLFSGLNRGKAVVKI